MRNLFLPDLITESIFDFDFAILKNRGINSIILDIDNTLVSHETVLPDEKVFSLIKSLKDDGFKLCIISNGKKDRVVKFTEKLDIPVILGIIKPKKRAYRLALSGLSVDAKSCAAIGDQIFTDVLGANRMGIFSVYTTPILKYENKFFYIKRFFENLILKKLK